MVTLQNRDSWYRNLPRSFKIGTAKDYNPVVNFHAFWIHELPYKRPVPIVYDEHYVKEAGCYGEKDGIFTAPKDGVYMCRVRVGAMDPRTNDWIFPEFKVACEDIEGVQTIKCTVLSPEDTRLFFPPPKQLQLSEGDRVRLVVESHVPDDKWDSLLPGITTWIYDVMELLQEQN